jgi:hypothetical protein
MIRKWKTFSIAAASFIVGACCTVAGCSQPQADATSAFKRQAIPAEALGMSAAVYMDFSAWLKTGDSVCGPSPDVAVCSERYEVIIERRDKQMYFLFAPKSGDRRISGGGMKYLVDVASGQIVERSIEK